MVLTGEILGDTSVVDNACDLAHIHSVRSIRSENTSTVSSVLGLTASPPT